jgi:hypothetical protein
VPSGVLRTALGTVMIVAALGLFEKAGIDLPLAVLLALPTALLAGLGAQLLARRARAVRAAPTEP